MDNRRMVEVKGDAAIKARNTVILVVIGIAAAILLFGSVAIVPAGHTGVRVTLGSVSEATMQEGIHFKVPLITNVVMMNNRVMKVDVDTASASKDLQNVTSTISLNYRLERGRSADIFKNVGVDYETVLIRPAIHECIKAVTAGYTAEELITMRQEVGTRIKELIAEKIDTFGLTTEVFNIVNFEFSEEFNKAIEAKQTAQQQALKAEQDLARIRVEAEQKIAEAQAEAEAYRLKSQEITDAMITIEAIKKWNGQLPIYYGGDSGNIFSIPIQ
ncbi:MAG: prohibitin family protein [Oscillospiraceae bacterium]|nr:prohibitin family protein [Oscillospiraceae bacterium]